MKPSHYNHIFEIEDGKTLLYNSASGALAEIDAESRSRLDRLLTHPETVETDQDKELLGGLIEGGYLIDDKIDEASLMKARSRRQKIE
ncbi:MAG: hypothetical protein PHR28_15115, partial [candidate division Zixibacteria bacterium]|nr:hypothetical protein [candidate division Zixibacteria bacterium]